MSNLPTANPLVQAGTRLPANDLTPNPIATPMPTPVAAAAPAAAGTGDAKEEYEEIREQVCIMLYYRRFERLDYIGESIMVSLLLFETTNFHMSNCFEWIGSVFFHSYGAH
jgi:hypothetical protein